MGDTEFASSPEKRVRDLDREYVLHSWSVQSQISPLPVAGAEGRYFWDYEGKRYLDFCSQLVNLNLGHQHPAVVEAIVEQAKTLMHDRPVAGQRQALGAGEPARRADAGRPEDVVLHQRRRRGQ